MAGRILPTGFSEGSQIEIGRYRTHEEHIVSCMFGREEEGMRNRRSRKFSSNPHLKVPPKQVAPIPLKSIYPKEILTQSS